MSQSQTLINTPNIKKQAFLDWERVRTQEDVRNWHKIYTPWWTDAEIEAIMKIYDKKLADPKPEDLIPEPSIFEQYLKISR